MHAQPTEDSPHGMSTNLAWGEGCGSVAIEVIHAQALFSSKKAPKPCFWGTCLMDGDLRRLRPSVVIAGIGGSDRLLLPIGPAYS